MAQQEEHEGGNEPGFEPLTKRQKWFLILGLSALAIAIVTLQYYGEQQLFQRQDARKLDRSRQRPARQAELLQRFDEAGAFYNQRARVRRGGRYGFVDTSLQLVVQPEYTNAGTRYRHGLVPARRDSLWGYLNRQGQPVIPFQYDSAATFRLSTAQASVWRGGRQYRIDTTGQCVAACPE
jgi:hypothetical protein